MRFTYVKICVMCFIFVKGRLKECFANTVPAYNLYVKNIYNIPKPKSTGADFAMLIYKSKVLCEKFAKKRCISVVPKEIFISSMRK